MGKGTLFTSLSKGLVSESSARKKLNDDLDEIEKVSLASKIVQKSNALKKSAFRE